MNWYQKYTQITQEERDRINDEMINELNMEYRKKWTPVDSSFIHEVSYNEKNRILKVKIRTQGTIKTYTFVNVPQDVFDNFIKAPSKGTFFNTIIKRRYDNVRVAALNAKDTVVNLFNLPAEDRYNVENSGSYVGIGHKKDIGKVLIWIMSKNGDIEIEETDNPSEDTHSDYFNIKHWQEHYIAMGRLEQDSKTCSIALKRWNQNKLSWIKRILREKFGNDIIIKAFLDN